MQIKVFKAGNMKDAMTAMKAELGEDAVILHSKKYKEGGILGLGSREVVEITAAVEEMSMPKKTEPPRLKHPTVMPNSLLTRYKTDGTEQGVNEAQQRAEQFTQLDTLAERVAEQKAQSHEPQKNFADALQLADEKITNDSADEDNVQPAEELPQPPPVEELPQPPTAEESPQPPSVEESPQPPSGEESPQPPTAEESPQPPSVEESPQPPSGEESPQPPPAEETSQPPTAEETPQPPPVEDTPQPPPVEESPQPPPVDETPQPPPVEESPQPPPAEDTPQPPPVFTQEQMAQTQAMLMAQFNQMQMMQQAAIAQAQAQAAEQLRLQQEQAAEQLRLQQEQVQQAAQQAALVQQPVANSQNEEKIKRLEDEIAQMKALLAEVLGRESKKGTITLHEALKLQEVNEEILTEMATQSTAGETLVDIHTPAAKITLSNYLTEHVKFSDGIKLNRHGVRIVALLGTTGVGKTTTLAKIAAKFVLEQRTSVALITADTYRISAVEQLKTYSDILELPLEIVYNPAELVAAIERHRDKDLILIDTAGRSQHNDYQLRELEEFLRINPRIEKHLVISSTTKYTDAKHIMHKFSQVEPDRIIFTKTDETGSLGMIINLLRDNNYSLSYVTTGQSVPDDIERANAEVLTNLLFKKLEAED